MKATIKGLLEFINAQPADRLITSHHSWAECAVGDYAREVLGHTIPKQMELEGIVCFHNDNWKAVFEDVVMQQLWAECGTALHDFMQRMTDRGLTLFWRLEPNYSVMDELASSAGRTYGDIQETLKDFNATPV